MDPDGAAKRRQHAEREEARVRFWRENGGACALAAFGLPTDAALAGERRDQRPRGGVQGAKLRPEARMDQLRVLAFLDLLNGITLDTRIACDRAAQAAQASASGGDGSTSHGAPGGPGSTRPDDDGNGHAGDEDHDTSGGDVSTSDAGGGASTSDRGR